MPFLNTQLLQLQPVRLSEEYSESSELGTSFALAKFSKYGNINSETIPIWWSWNWANQPQFQLTVTFSASTSAYVHRARVIEADATETACCTLVYLSMWYKQQLQHTDSGHLWTLGTNRAGMLHDHRSRSTTDTMENQLLIIEDLENTIRSRPVNENLCSYVLSTSRGLLDATNPNEVRHRVWRLYIHLVQGRAECIGQQRYLLFDLIRKNDRRSEDIPFRIDLLNGK